MVAGLVNTALGYLMYLAMLLAAPYLVAYSLSYVLGIVVSYALNTWFVFRRPWDWHRLLAYPFVYLAQYLLGASCLALLVETFGMARELAPLAVVILTLPLTFLLSRLIIKGKTNDIV